VGEATRSSESDCSAWQQGSLSSRAQQMIEMLLPIYCRGRKGLKAFENATPLTASNHRPVVQSGCVSLGRRSTLLAVHGVPEVEQVCGSLAKESARGRRGRRLRRRGPSLDLFHRIGLRGWRCRRLGCCRSCLGLWLRDGLHSDLGLRGPRGLVLCPSRPPPPSLGLRRIRLGRLWRSVCRGLLFWCLRLRIFWNCCFHIGHFLNCPEIF
jgi:hypothetical protein